MTRKKNKIVTFIVSFIPGAGEMYLGFMRQGTSIMLFFTALVAIAGFLQMEALVFLTPVVWFYSFFHSNNLNGLPDEEFYAIEDNIPFHMDQKTFLYSRYTFTKYRRLFAFLLIFFGLSMIWNNISTLFYRYLLPLLQVSEVWENMIYFVFHMLPQSVVAIGIIAVGVLMIQDKKKELDV